jgi:serine/threonine-protein kinase HipA
MLNLIFGNSDNHGRNMSFIKYEGDIQFAPIYDFAPMKADPEMVTRLFKWESGCENAGMVYFEAVANALSKYCAPDDLLAYLREIAQSLLDIKSRLIAYQCPESILNFPTINFARTADKLKQMGVLDE